MLVDDEQDVLSFTTNIQTVIRCPVCGTYTRKRDPEQHAECPNCHWRQG
jgi:rubrerythrin